MRYGHGLRYRRGMGHGARARAGAQGGARPQLLTPNARDSVDLLHLLMLDVTPMPSRQRRPCSIAVCRQSPWPRIPMCTLPTLGRAPQLNTAEDDERDVASQCLQSSPAELWERCFQSLADIRGTPALQDDRARAPKPEGNKPEGEESTGPEVAGGREGRGSGHPLEIDGECIQSATPIGGA